MKINGKEKLNRNDYDKVLIDLTGKEIKVSATSKCSYKTMPSGNKFSKTLRGLSDEEKVLEIVDLFLRSYKINEINDLEHIDHYPGYYSTAKANYNSESVILGVKLPEGNELSHKIMKKIIESYKRNLYEYAFSENAEINGISNSPYGCEFNKNDDVIVLLSKKEDYQDIISAGEYAFLEELILSKLDYKNLAYLQGEFTNCPYHPLRFHVIYLHCGDLKIKISEPIRDYVFNIINKYNRELEKRESMQVRIREYKE